MSRINAIHPTRLGNLLCRVGASAHECYFCKKHILRRRLNCRLEFPKTRHDKTAATLKSKTPPPSAQHKKTQTLRKCQHAQLITLRVVLHAWETKCSTCETIRGFRSTTTKLLFGDLFARSHKPRSWATCAAHNEAQNTCQWESESYAIECLPTTNTHTHTYTRENELVWSKMRNRSIAIHGRPSTATWTHVRGECVGCTPTTQFNRYLLWIVSRLYKHTEKIRWRSNFRRHWFSEDIDGVVLHTDFTLLTMLMSNMAAAGALSADTQIRQLDKYHVSVSIMSTPLSHTLFMRLCILETRLIDLLLFDCGTSAESRPARRRWSGREESRRAGGVSVC